MSALAEAEPANALEPTLVLSKDQIDFYWREGYLVIPNLTTPEELAHLRVAYDRIFEQRCGRDVGDQFDLAGTDEEGKRASLPQILGPRKYAPEFPRSQMWVNAEAIAKQILGSEAKFQGDHAILKPAFHGATTPWHQDEAYWGPQLQYNSFSTWVPLQEATIEMGCMWFVPGSHKWDIEPHHCINNDPRIHGLEVDRPERFEKTSVACPLPPGGCTIHNNRTLHYGGPNTTAQTRRAYILGFGLPSKPYPTERRFPWNELKQTARDARAKKAQEEQKKVERPLNS